MITVIDLLMVLSTMSKGSFECYSLNPPDNECYITLCNIIHEWHSYLMQSLYLFLRSFNKLFKIAFLSHLDWQILTDV